MWNLRSILLSSIIEDNTLGRFSQEISEMAQNLDSILLSSDIDDDTLGRFS